MYKKKRNIGCFKQRCNDCRLLSKPCPRECIETVLVSCTKRWLIAAPKNSIMYTYIVECLRHHPETAIPQNMTHSFDHYFHFNHLLGRFKTSVFVFILSICLTFCSLLLAFRFFSFRFTKGKHYISPWYPARCHCYCEKKHRFFCCCFGFFFVLFLFFYFYFLNGSISYVLNSISECSRKRNGCWC